jgi:hypothetical protein
MEMGAAHLLQIDVATTLSYRVSAANGAKTPHMTHGFKHEAVLNRRH